MLLDLLEPPGRCSGCWPHDGEVDGCAVEESDCGRTMELGRGPFPSITGIVWESTAAHRAGRYTVGPPNVSVDVEQGDEGRWGFAADEYGAPRLCTGLAHSKMLQ